MTQEEIIKNEQLKRGKKVFIILGCFVSLILFFLSGLTFYKRIQYQNNCTIETEAIVSDYKRYYDSNSDSIDNEYIYYPIVVFAANEEVYTVELDYGSNKKEYDIGDAVQIKYNPNNPNQVILANDKSGYIIAIVIFVTGCIVLLISIKNAKKKIDNLYKDDTIKNEEHVITGSSKELLNDSNASYDSQGVIHEDNCIDLKNKYNMPLENADYSRVDGQGVIHDKDCHESKRKRDKIDDEYDYHYEDKK